MLDNNTFDLGASIGFDGLIAVIPAGSPTGAIVPDHMYFGPALLFGNWISVFFELVFYRCCGFGFSPPGDRRIKNSLMKESLGKMLFLVSPGFATHGYENPVGKSQICTVSFESVKHFRSGFTSGHSHEGYLALMNSRFSQSMHSEQDHFQPGRFVGEGSPDIGTSEEVGN